MVRSGCVGALVRLAVLACVILPARPAEAQLGVSLRGFVYGLPSEGAVVSGDITFQATVFVPAERGSQFLPIPVVFPANGVAARTADSTAAVARTRIYNGQLLNLHVLPEGGVWTVRVVRDAPTLRITGRVTAINGVTSGGIDNSQTTDCADPRECVTAGVVSTLSIDLGPFAGNTTVQVQTGFGTVMTWVFAGCHYDIDAVVIQGRVFATYIESPIPQCPSRLPHGVSFKGWLFGRSTPSLLPPASSLPAGIALPLDRGASAAPVAITFPEALNVRTVDMQVAGETYQTTVRNGELMELYSLQEGATTRAWHVRDVGTITVKGRIVDVWESTGTPVQGMPTLGGFFCVDGRTCTGPLGPVGRFALDLGAASGNATITLDAGLATLPRESICRDAVVTVEVVVVGGRLFASRVGGRAGVCGPFEPI